MKSILGEDQIVEDADDNCYDCFMPVNPYSASDSQTLSDPPNRVDSKWQETKTLFWILLIWCWGILLPNATMKIFQIQHTAVIVMLHSGNDWQVEWKDYWLLLCAIELTFACLWITAVVLKSYKFTFRLFMFIYLWSLANILYGLMVSS